MCLAASGCGSPDKEREGGLAQAAESQRQAENILQESEAQNMESKPQNAEEPQAGQSVQTDWDGESESARMNRESLSDVEEPSAKPEDGDGSKYQADFLGNDTSKITSCILYRNGKIEALDLSTAKGKYFIRMLAGYFRDWEAGYTDFYGGIGIGWQELEARERPDSYFIELQIEDSVPMTFHELVAKEDNIRVAEGYDTVIVEANFNTGYLALFWNSDETDVFWGEAPNINKLEEDFREKCQAWEKITDWDQAFAELQAPQAPEE